MKTLSWSAGIALLTAALCVSPASAETVKCQRSIAKAGSQFVQAKMKALQKCEDAVVAGKITGPCPDTKAGDAITKANTKLSSAIDKSCGGANKVCDGGVGEGEDTPSSVGWPNACPNFERGSCNNAISDCGDIATCIACIGEAAIDQAIDLYYDGLALPSTTNKTLNKCQKTIGKATAAFFTAKTKALQKCWDARLNDKHGLSCVPPAAGDGKYLAAIAKAEAKKISSICKACGGADKGCDQNITGPSSGTVYTGTGGTDDLSVAAIGFPANCPSLTIPGGASCAQPIANLADIVECVDCVTEFKADCTDRLQTPEFASYPSECNVCTLPAPVGPCPTQFEFTADGPNVDLDTGFTGLATDAHVPTNGRLTLSISGCAGVANPTCGQCNVSGPLENVGGAAFDNHRCKDKSWISCDIDQDCIDAGATGPCVFYFGAPLPLVAGAVSTCVINQLTGPVSGTVNIDDGTSTTNVPLASNVHPTGTVFAPCPNCVSGVCSAAGAPRDGQPCVVQGTGEFGDVSLDCPPDPAASAGILTINLNIATGNQTRTLSAAQPNCTQTGYTGKKCFCGTCNNAAAEACTVNGDCPISGGNPGICNGRRCLSGPNVGAPCNNDSACPGGSGLCNRPGEATQPNVCQDNTTTPMTDESLCMDLGGNEGECPFGPVDGLCSIQRQIGCSSNADCAPSMTCMGCLPGQTCIARQRPCFLDQGTIGGSVSVAGSPDVPCGGIANPTVGSFFCVAPVAATSVNAAGGLPGLGRVLIPGTAVITP